MTRSQTAPISWFRNTAPYINLHRGSTFVLMIPGDVQQQGRMPTLLNDVALLASLGVRLVLVVGSRAQIDEQLADADVPSSVHRDRRISSAEAMPQIQQAIGAQRTELEAMLSMSMPNSPMAGARLRAVSGNFVTAQPLGVVDGVDFQHTGRVRRVDGAAILAQLDARNLVLLNVLGYSPTGEAFNLALDDVAVSTAEELQADKLIILAPGEGVHDAQGNLIRQCLAGEVAELAPAEAAERHLLKIGAAVCDAGVPRCHIVSYTNPDSLLTELFTTDGSGTMISSQPYECSRWADINDVGGVLELIEPLEESGVLLKRSRELLENEIGQFRILERDGRIIGCAALYPFAQEQTGELACIVTHEDYRGEQRARRLLLELEREAIDQGLADVFVLTTQTAHWFLEQGFVEGSLDTLPPARQALYNLQRNSKVFRKTLQTRA